MKRKKDCGGWDVKCEVWRGGGGGGGCCWQHHPTCKYWQTDVATDRFDCMGLKYNGHLENNLSTLNMLGGTVDATDHPLSVLTATCTAECSKTAEYQSDAEWSQYSVLQDLYYFFISVSTYWSTSTSGNSTFTFTFIHLADAFIQSDLQLRNTISDTL